jgi:protein-tyrosine-phosphatase
MTGISERPAASEPGAVVRTIHYALTRPSILRVKGKVREMAWRVRERAIRNPPLRAPVRSIVFVCLGNICRSPFAASLAAARLRQRGGGQMKIISAGIRPSQAARPPAEACEAAACFALSLDGHIPAALTPEIVEGSDLVVVMEVQQLVQLHEAYPAHRDRIVLLSLFDREASGAYERCNIADPFGHQSAVFDACYCRIARAVDALLSELFVPAGRGVEQQRR